MNRRSALQAKVLKGPPRRHLNLVQGRNRLSRTFRSHVGGKAFSAPHLPGTTRNVAPNSGQTVLGPVDQTLRNLPNIAFSSPKTRLAPEVIDHSAKDWSPVGRTGKGPVRPGFQQLSGATACCHPERRSVIWRRASACRRSGNPGIETEVEPINATDKSLAVLESLSATEGPHRLADIATPRE